MIPVRLQEGEILDGKYRIQGVIGEGAMGVVVSAWHIDLQQKVAIKFLHPLLAQREESVQRFLHEARAVVRIESEHVARVLDVGRSEGAAPYLVMEFLEGEDLAATLRRRRSFPVQEAVLYLQQACEAIAEAHAAGVVHRDLKPANLFLVERGTEPPRIKVLDFGIAKTTMVGAEALLTNTSVIMGSPLYMSPEQLRSTRDVDDKTDIWALGVILYEMLTGTEPFVAPTLPQLCTMILEGAPAAPRSVRPEIPPQLERVVLRCLEKGPLARFSSVAELSMALVPFGPSGALSSAERAARSFMRTGSGLKSTLPPVLTAPPTSFFAPSARRSRFILAAVLLVGTALLLAVLLRGRGAERPAASSGSRSPQALTSAGASPHTEGGEPFPTPASVPSPEPASVPSPEPASVPLSTVVEPGPAEPPRLGDAAALRTSRVEKSKRPVASSPRALPAAPPLPPSAPNRGPAVRSGFDPPADNFGGRE